MRHETPSFTAGWVAVMRGLGSYLPARLRLVEDPYGFRFTRAWPVQEPCPACGLRVSRDRPACSACHAEFPGPALIGTEVFA